MEATPDEINFILAHIWGFYILLIVAIALTIGWVLWEFWVTPKAAKAVRKADRKKKLMLDISRPDGQAEYVVPDKVFPIGVATTKNFERMYMVATPMVEATSEDKDEIAHVHNVFTAKNFLGQIPIFRCYSAGVIAVTAQSLASLQYSQGTERKRKFQLPIKIERVIKDKDTGATQIIETREIEVLLPIDAKAAYDAVSTVFPPSKWREAVEEVKVNVMLKLRKLSEQYKPILYAGIALAVIGAILCGVAVVLG